MHRAGGELPPCPGGTALGRWHYDPGVPWSQIGTLKCESSHRNQSCENIEVVQPMLNRARWVTDGCALHGECTHALRADGTHARNVVFIGDSLTRRIAQELARINRQNHVVSHYMNEFNTSGLEAAIRHPGSVDCKHTDHEPKNQYCIHYILMRGTTMDELPVGIDDAPHLFSQVASIPGLEILVWGIGLWPLRDEPMETYVRFMDRMVAAARAAQSRGVRVIYKTTSFTHGEIGTRHVGFSVRKLQAMNALAAHMLHSSGLREVIDDLQPSVLMPLDFEDAAHYNPNGPTMRTVINITRHVLCHPRAPPPPASRAGGDGGEPGQGAGADGRDGGREGPGPEEQTALLAEHLSQLQARQEREAAASVALQHQQQQQQQRQQQAADAERVGGGKDTEGEGNVEVEEGEKEEDQGGFSTA
ncbi:hypothetical protein FOA52_005504 [Chlamydomonas sp. UWO 241]|nr:hypothetical protein FOA52_005504 [Chlamydomonas sp. UWO 241]